MEQFLPLSDPAGQLFGLVMTALVVMGSPGPATIGVTAAAGAFGLRRSLAFTAGVVLGTTAVLLAVAAGLASLLAARPGLALGFAVLSAAYMLYLAVRIARAPPLSQAAEPGAGPSLAGGVLLAVANPKAYAAIAAVLGGAGPATPATVAVLAAMIILIHGAWLAAGAAFARLLRRPLASRVVNLAFAAILVVSTVPALRSLLP